MNKFYSLLTIFSQKSKPKSVYVPLLFPKVLNVLEDLSQYGEVFHRLNKQIFHPSMQLF